MVNLYLDLDGFLADFDKYFVEFFGLDNKQIPNKLMWEKIEAHGEFFKSLPLMEGALEFFNEFYFLGPIILTACPKTDYQRSALHKRSWVYDKLDPDTPVIPMLGGINKGLFMHSRGDILIDDFKKNCIAWEEMGGRAIHHTNFPETREKLLRMIYESV